MCVISKMMKKQKVDIALKSTLDDKQSRRDRVAVFISNTFGSIKFLLACVCFFIYWITLNLGLIPGLHPFDKYPFPALQTVVSIFAIILSVSVLISQNRQGRLEKLSQQVEFEVNVHAETEITKVLSMLHEIQKKLGIDKQDQELETMKENLDLQELHQKLDEQE
jgi:uncharacterized membrane protein